MLRQGLRFALCKLFDGPALAVSVLDGLARMTGGWLRICGRCCHAYRAAENELAAAAADPFTCDPVPLTRLSSLASTIGTTGGACMDELIADFITDTTEALGGLDHALLQLERVPDNPAMIASVFRLMHTIKGTCGFLGLARLELLSHAAEELLGEMRDGSLAPTPLRVGLVLAGVDQIKIIVAEIAATGAEPLDDNRALIAALLAAAAERDLAGTELLQTDPKPGPRNKSAPDGGQKVKQSQTVRVNVNAIEALMTLVSEIVLTRNQLLQLARAQLDGRFTAPLQRLSHLTSNLQEGVMRARMQPIELAWSRLPRLVRDLALELGKSIDLRMEGGSTELDRQVLELIRDPLTHMVRNSADHGLETVTERRAAGKSDAGTITLRAYHEGGHIVVEVGDDGRGLSVPAIKARAVALGHITPSEAEALNDRQVLDCIYRPGFSMAAAVTAVSGRGVGMDVVRTNIEQISGSIDLRSRAGQGVTFTINIPLTLAIISALIVEVGGERFALPQSAVVELVRTVRNDTGAVVSPHCADAKAVQTGDPARKRGPTIEQINGTPVLRLRERLLPLVPLVSLLQLTGVEPTTSEGRTVIIMAVGAATFGVAVDRVFDVEEIVAKPLARLLRHIPLFSGNTILGDGAVVMILDPGGIVRAVGLAAATVSSAAVATASNAIVATEAPTALLLFRTSATGPQSCLPLGLVARIEDIDSSLIQHSSGRLVMEYRGGLMPLVDLDAGRQAYGPTGRVPVLVFIDRNRRMGMIVHEILDVIEERLTVEVSAARTSLLGTAIVAGQVTEVVDTGYWLVQALSDWFEDGHRWETSPRLLVVEDNAFFLQMLMPTLSSAGYIVTAVASAEAALALRDQTAAHFDAIISDIEMPGMSGLAFVRALRAGGRWAGLPVIALSGRYGPDGIRQTTEAGFSDHIGKFDRERLLQSLRTHLPVPAPTSQPISQQVSVSGTAQAAA